jgi:hypothetical protein
MIVVQIFLLFAFLSWCVAPPVCYDKYPWGRGPPCGATAAHREQCECDVGKHGGFACLPRYCDYDDVQPDLPSVEEFRRCTLNDSVERTYFQSNVLLQNGAFALTVPHWLPIVFGDVSSHGNHSIQIKSTCVEDNIWLATKPRIVELPRTGQENFVLTLENVPTNATEIDSIELLLSLNNNTDTEAEIKQCLSWVPAAARLPAKVEAFKKLNCSWLQSPKLDCSAVAHSLVSGSEVNTKFCLQK